MELGTSKESAAYSQDAPNVTETVKLWESLKHTKINHLHEAIPSLTETVKLGRKFASLIRKALLVLS